MKAPTQISNNARSDVVWFYHFLHFQHKYKAHSWPNVPLHVINTNNAIFFPIISNNVGKLIVRGSSKDTLCQNSWRMWCVFSLAGGEGEARWASTHHTPRAMTTQQCPPHRWPGLAPHDIWPQRPGTFSFPLFKMRQWFPFNTCSS